MAEIDRGTSEPRAQREHKLLRIMMAAMTVAFLSTASLALLSNQSPETSPVPAGISYTTHLPILITSDANFADAGNPGTYGVTGGTGIASDPYIISGWDIDASSTHGT